MVGLAEADFVFGKHGFSFFPGEIGTEESGSVIVVPIMVWSGAMGQNRGGFVVGVTKTGAKIVESPAVGEFLRQFVFGHGSGSAGWLGLAGGRCGSRGRSRHRIRDFVEKGQQGRIPGRFGSGFGLGLGGLGFAGVEGFEIPHPFIREHAVTVFHFIDHPTQRHDDFFRIRDHRHYEVR